MEFDSAPCREDCRQGRSIGSKADPVEKVLRVYKRPGFPTNELAAPQQRLMLRRAIVCEVRPPLYWANSLAQPRGPGSERLSLRDRRDA